MIHGVALASKEMSPGLSIVLTTVATVVNDVKMRYEISRLFSSLFKGMGSVHPELLFYCDARRLPRGKFFQRVYELKEEIDIFIEEENRTGA